MGIFQLGPNNGIKFGIQWGLERSPPQAKRWGVYERSHCLRRFVCYDWGLNPNKAQAYKNRGPRHISTLTLDFCFDITATPLRQSRL